MNSNTLKEKLKNKWILTDTNILLKASRNPEAFSDVFNLIKDANCQMAYCQLVRAEFLQSVWQTKLIDAQEKFLEDLNMVDLPLRPLAELTNLVMKNTRQLRKSQKPLPDLTDSYLIALAQKYNPNLVVLTTNHKDFAYTLKRFYVEALEISEKEILTVGFYSAS